MTDSIIGARIDYPGFEGRIAKRAFFLIDQEGIVQGKWIGEVLLKAASKVAGKAEGTNGQKPSEM